MQKFEHFQTKCLNFLTTLEAAQKYLKCHLSENRSINKPRQSLADLGEGAAIEAM